MLDTRINADTYFYQLDELIQNTIVTDKKRNDKISLNDGVKKAVEYIYSSHNKNSKVMIAGNGGSAAIASHLCNDICKSLKIKAMTFSEVSLITALANDNGYECIFDSPLNMWATKEDTFVAVSSSGESTNILRAAMEANGKGCTVITFTGFDTMNSLRQLGDLNFYIASYSYGFVEVAHSALTHCITDMAMAAI